MTEPTTKPPGTYNRFYWKDWLLISVLIILNSLVMLSSSSSVMDTARDIYYAWQIATAAGFPLEGPLLASSIHSGPLWFYVLAIPLLFSKNWMLVSFWVGLLSGMKFALAYACGNRLGSRKFGVIWACLLAFPNLAAVNYLTFTHVNLVETTVMLTIYSLIRWQYGEKHWFLMMCFALGLGLHAHPSVFALGVVLAPVIALSIYRKQLTWRYLAGGLSLVLAPLIPYLVSQSLRSWPDFHTTRSYFESQPILNNLLGFFDVSSGAFVDGPVVALGHILDLQGVPLWFGYVTVALVLVTGLLLAIRAILLKDHQRPAVFLLLSTLTIIASIALIREITPYYMVLVAYPTAYGLVAWGWSNTRILPARTLTGIFATISIVFVLGFFFKTLEMGRSGHSKIGGATLYNVRSHALDAVTDRMYFPASARHQLGSFICDQQSPVFFHGTASLVLEQSYGLEAQMLCNTDSVYIGGKGTGLHFFGVSRWDIAHLGITTRTNTIGPLSLEPVTRVIAPDSPELLPNGAIYPPRKFINSANQDYTLSFTTSPQELVAITNLYHYWMQYSFKVSLNGKPIEPLFQGTLSSYFSCAPCTGNETQNWQITITAPGPELVEIVTFTPVYINTQNL